eukprot:COSAG01_NODE_8446_length_2783_cov_2.245902_3_plen_319_part_01
MPAALFLLRPHLLVVALLIRPAASGGSAAAATASCAGQDGLSVWQLDQLYPAAVPAGKHSAHTHAHPYACFAPPNRWVQWRGWGGGLSWHARRFTAGRAAAASGGGPAAAAAAVAAQQPVLLEGAGGVALAKAVLPPAVGTLAPASPHCVFTGLGLTRTLRRHAPAPARNAPLPRASDNARARRVQVCGTIRELLAPSLSLAHTQKRDSVDGLPVSRPFPFWNRSILTEIYLCHACSCQEILRTETAGQEFQVQHRALRTEHKWRWAQLATRMSGAVPALDRALTVPLTQSAARARVAGGSARPALCRRGSGGGGGQRA